MDYIVKQLGIEYLDQVLALVWKTFMEFEAPDYTQEGISSFRKDILDNEGFRESCRNGTNRMWGSLVQDTLVAVLVMRSESHICLFFTDKEYQRRGIATGLFKQLVFESKGQFPKIHELTVNSSPYGIPFYHHLGFEDLTSEQTVEGIRFVPMRYSLEDA